MAGVPRERHGEVPPSPARRVAKTLSLTAFLLLLFLSVWSFHAVGAGHVLSVGGAGAFLSAFLGAGVGCLGLERDEGEDPMKIFIGCGLVGAILIVGALVAVEADGKGRAEGGRSSISTR